jgi:hypothetical protein
LRRKIQRSFLAGIVAACLAGGLVAAEPTTLRYAPERGLEISYDIEIEADMEMGGGGMSETQEMEFVGVFTDTVKRVSGGKIVVEREFDRFAAIIEGEEEEAPPGVVDQIQTYTFNERGQIQDIEVSGGDPDMLGGAPNPMDFVAAGLVRIPYPEGPVEVGDEWDITEGLTFVSEELDVEATATLVGFYESGGMQVALTDTAFAASGTIEGEQGGPDTTMSFEGAMLQSTRVEDGAILGMRARMDAKSVFSMGEMGSLEVTIDDLTMEVRVTD